MNTQTIIQTVTNQGAMKQIVDNKVQTKTAYQFSKTKIQESYFYTLRSIVGTNNKKQKSL